MQTPKDVTGVKRILGMCHYLTTFLTILAIRQIVKKTEKKTAFEMDRIGRERTKIVKISNHKDTCTHKL